ncbi:MAG: hypothetical protein BAJATHORv1_30487 [Candidatus Thorarchaeota archaeon]|nr:MAG: hypothetical protein BAJATHORv1_30487 [Candidatus Thorarchaeota archaeon]
MKRLQVPFIEQQQNNDCVIACLEMIFEYLVRKYDEIATFTRKELLKIIDISIIGTRICDVELLNEHKKLEKYRYQPRFFCSPGSIQHIWEQIDKERPIIAYIIKKFLGNQIKHAILVNGYSKDKTKLSICDPLEEQPTLLSTGQFQERWKLFHKYHVYYEVVEVLQPKITEYIE